jgi:hypothetical protein
MNLEQPLDASPQIETHNADAGAHAEAMALKQDKAEVSATYLLSLVCEKLAAGEAVSINFQGDSILYGQTTGGEAATIAAINSSSQLRSITPIPETFKQAVALMHPTATITVTNRGYPGDTAASSYARWSASSVGDVTIINPCLNDANAYGNPVTQPAVDYPTYIADLRTYVTSLTAAGSLVIFMQPPIPQSNTDNGKSRRYSAAAKALVESLGGIVVDIEQMIRVFLKSRADSIHMDAQLYAHAGCCLAALFSGYAGRIEQVAPGSQIALRTRSIWPLAFTASGTNIARTREAGYTDIGNSLVDRWLPLFVTAPCRLNVRMFQVSFTGAVRMLRIARGAAIALKGDGTSTSDSWVVEQPRDFFEIGTDAVGGQPEQPMVGPLLMPGLNLISLTNDLSTNNYGISSVWFAPPEVSCAYMAARIMKSGGQTVTDTAALNPGTASFAVSVLVGGHHLYSNPDSAISLLNKVTGNTGWKLDLGTDRKLVLTVYNGSTSTAYTAPVAAEYDQTQRWTFGFLMSRANRVYFHCNGESLGSVVCTATAAYNVDSTGTNLTALTGAPAKIYIGGIWFCTSTTVDFPKTMALLNWGPDASGVYTEILP